MAFLVPKTLYQSKNKFLELIVMAKNDPFYSIFQEYIDKINSKWITGTLQYIKQNDYPLYMKIKDVEYKLDQAYKLNDIETFRSLSNEWYYLHLDAIVVFKTATKHEDLELFAGVFRLGS